MPIPILVVFVLCFMFYCFYHYVESDRKTFIRTLIEFILFCVLMLSWFVCSLCLAERISKEIKITEISNKDETNTQFLLIEDRFINLNRVIGCVFKSDKVKCSYMEKYSLGLDLGDITSDIRNLKIEAVK